MERRAKEGESPVRETVLGFIYLFSSRTGHEKPCLKLAGPPAKAKYIDWSIAN